MPLEHLNLKADEVEDEISDDDLLEAEGIELEEDLRTPEEITLDREQAARRVEKKAKASPIALQPDLVDRALAILTDAVKLGDPEAIGAAQQAVEDARTETMRLAQRQKDLNAASVAAQAIKKAEASAKKLALADETEARLRKRSPVVRFECPGRRVVTVRMTGLDLEVPVIQAAITRLAIAQSRALADQVIASRQVGKSVPVRDFLTGMLNADDGLRRAIEMKICKVTKLTPKENGK